MPLSVVLHEGDRGIINDLLSRFNDDVCAVATEFPQRAWDAWSDNSRLGR